MHILFVFFYRDPDFKGYLNVICEEDCTVSYHPCCWKAFKDQHYGSINRMSDKVGGVQCCVPSHYLSFDICHYCVLFYYKAMFPSSIFTLFHWLVIHLQVSPKKVLISILHITLFPLYNSVSYLTFSISFYSLCCLLVVQVYSSHTSACPSILFYSLSSLTPCNWYHHCLFTGPYPLCPLSPLLGEDHIFPLIPLLKTVSLVFALSGLFR